MLQVRHLTLIGATILMALIAGFFYAYACSVMVGLDRLDAADFIRTMQAINASVRNAAFALSFFGALLLSGAAALLYLPRWRTRTAWLAIVAFLLYALGAFAVTFLVSVPLNEELARVVDLTPGPALDATRRAYADAWTRWNIVRTLAATAACLALCIATYCAGRDSARSFQ